MKKKEFTLEDLATMTAREFLIIGDRFTNLEGRFDKLEKEMREGFKQIDSRLRNISVRLDLLETDVADLRKLHKELREIYHLFDQVATRKELKTLEKRVFKLEKQIGLA